MTDSPAKPRGRGRPPQNPPGTTASDRKALARRQNRAAGGHDLHVDLGPTAWRALQRLAPPRKRGPFIEKLILQAAAKAGATD